MIISGNTVHVLIKHLNDPKHFHELMLFWLFWQRPMTRMALFIMACICIELPFCIKCSPKHSVCVRICVCVYIYTYPSLITPLLCSVAENIKAPQLAIIWLWSLENKLVTYCSMTSSCSITFSSPKQTLSISQYGPSKPLLHSVADCSIILEHASFTRLWALGEDLQAF